MIKFKPAYIVTAFVLLTTQIALAQPQQAATDQQTDLSDLDIRELINIEVTSPSKKTEKVANVASAITVVTAEDIRRSGASSIMEALRMVPGLHIAQIDKEQWSISSRGFSGLFADKLLVLVDGRSVYTPLFGGVFWNEQDLMLEDVERIEVIRGPGATLWGANAVNGVINIITRPAGDTHGGLVAGGGGSEQRGFGSLRYGEQVGDTDYRVYSKYANRDESKLESGLKAHDTWEDVRSGFRTDTKLSSHDTVTLQGDAFYADAGWDRIEPSLSEISIQDDANRYSNAQNLLGRYRHAPSADEDVQLQMYYDRIDRNDFLLEQKRDTVDLDFQHRFSPFENHELLYGVGYRWYQDEMDGTFSVSVDPDSRDLGLGTGFVQDEITLVPDRLRAIVGSKVEHNELSGWEALPSFRMIYTPDSEQSFWGAFSRSVRSPARFNHDGRLVLGVAPGTDETSGLPSALTLSGDRDYDAEDLLAYEAGYRAQLDPKVAVDVAGFFNSYSNLESAEPISTPFANTFNNSPYVEVPFRVDNNLAAESFGGEASIEVRALSSLRLIGTYSHNDIHLTKRRDSQDSIFSGGEEQFPNEQWMLRSLLDLPANFEFDMALRYVDSVETFDIQDYYAFDARIGYRPTERLEFSLVGKNLFDSQHIEFASNLVDTQRTEMQREVLGKVTYRF